MAIDRNELVRAVTDLGLAGRAVCLHSSLKSHGPVDGGAATVVDAFLATGATLLVPTFSFAYAVTAPPDMRPPRNGADYVGWTSEGGLPVTGGTTPRVFSTDANDTETGAVPTEVLSRPGRERGNHPLCSFTAVGPSAKALVAHQTPTDVYAPLSALAERDGVVVLAGVGLNRMTIVHHAESVAGRTLFRRWAFVNGTVTMVPVGGCSEGFHRLREALAPVVATRRVGGALWLAFPARTVVEIASDIIRQDPRSTACPDEACIRCADAVAGGPILGTNDRQSTRATR